MAARAKRNTIKLDASLIRLSPSSMAVILLGTFSCCNTLVAAIASGGEIIAPSRKPRGKEKPGITACAVKATAVAVNITKPNASIKMGRRNFQKSFQEVFQAAAYNKGGRKIINTRSGCKV